MLFFVIKPTARVYDQQYQEIFLKRFEILFEIEVGFFKREAGLECRTAIHSNLFRQNDFNENLYS